MKKHLITALIGLGIVAVLIATYINGGNTHGDPESWINERHAQQVKLRQAEADDFCLKCHAKRRNETKQQTLTGFCNNCHTQRGVANVDIQVREE